jgi:D-amino-acid dehydrogenase
MKNRHPIVVAGAGIIGATIAYELSARGEKVILVDRQEPGRGASFGNMASIAVNGFDAVSRPSTWRKIPGWLLNPQAPVAADPKQAIRMLPWFLKFLAAGTASRVEAIEAAGASLATRALGDLRNLLDRIDAGDMLSQATCLSLYESEKAFEADSGNRQLMERYGFPYQVLTGAAIREHEPLLGPTIVKATLLPQNHFLSDPFKLVRRVVEAMQGHGGELVTGDIARVERDNRGITAVILKDGRRLETDRLVVAMGIHSREIAATLGEPIPMETERGYHTQIMSPGIDLTYSLIWPERAFMITPMAGGVRVGGSVEMAALAKPPNWRRARVLVENAKLAIPSLKVEDYTEWMGNRPSLPEPLPILSPSTKTKGLFYATGHVHLGVTYAPTTALLMADMVQGRPPLVDMHPFRIDRF